MEGSLGVRLACENPFARLATPAPESLESWKLGLGFRV